METYEAIMTRRSTNVAPDRVPPREAVDRLLEAAVRAPTHHLTQPWRFIVLAGEAVTGLGRAWAAGMEADGKNSDGIVDKTRRAPVIVCVIATPKPHLPKVVEVEEHHAVGAAIQNLLLAAHDAGFGAWLRTGPAASMTTVRDYLSVGDNETIAGFVYLGYPLEGDQERPRTRRTDHADLTEWRGWG